MNPEPGTRNSELSTDSDSIWMRWALREAEKAFDEGEVPVGAVIVSENRIIGRAHNQTETLQDPTAHAEMIAISAAANTLGSWRLEGCTLYVTLEPCAMCAGAVVLSRIRRVVFGALDPKAGACGSLRNLVQDARLNHRVELASGVLDAEVSGLMKAFFHNLRDVKRSRRQADGEAR
ncbi:MAG: tRNA adenosine(34) deaminase TadA [bacterium]|nr:tRNA adenosine(34) deaminase TadA [bacterium]